MYVIGVTLVFFLVVGSFFVSQAFFYSMTGRIFWRAMTPSGIRFSLLPNDSIELDSFMVLEEWAALMFMCSSIVLPLIAFNSMGFISIF